MSNKKRQKTENNDSQKSATPDLVPGTQALAYKSELDFWGGKWSQQDVITDHNYLKINPVSSLSDNDTVLEFVLPSANEWCYDMSNLRLFLNIRLMNGNNRVGFSSKSSKDRAESTDNSDDWDPVTVCNNVLNSMFSKCQVQINGYLINSHNANHHYRSFIETSLNYSAGSKFALLKNLTGFSMDTGLAPEKAEYSSNSGMFLRSQLTENGALVCLTGNFRFRIGKFEKKLLLGKLSHDVFTLSRLIVPGTEIIIKLVRNPDNLTLMYDKTKAPPHHITTPPQYNIKIEKACVEALRFKLAPQTVSYINHRLSSSPACYYFDRIEMRTFHIPGSVLSWQASGIFGAGAAPLRMFFGLIETASYNGTITSNPLAFRHFKLNNCQLLVDNVTKDMITIENEWKGSGCMSAYLNLLKALRVLNTNMDLDLTLDSYRDGPICIQGFDLAADTSSASKTEEGVVSLNLTFSEPTPSSGLIGVCYGCFHGTMKIYHDKHVEMFDKIVI